jgi:hypothetical protein
VTRHDNPAAKQRLGVIGGGERRAFLHGEQRAGRGISSRIELDRDAAPIEGGNTLGDVRSRDGNS